MADVEKLYTKEVYEQAKRVGNTFDDYETWKRKEAEVQSKRKPPEPEKELSKQERCELAIAAYEFGLEHNVPRNHIELKELKELLGVKDKEADKPVS